MVIIITEDRENELRFHDKLVWKIPWKYHESKSPKKKKYVVKNEDAKKEEAREPLLLLFPCHVFKERLDVSHAVFWSHLIASWDLLKKNTKLWNLCLGNLPKLSKKKRVFMDTCCKSEHLVESRSTGETFLIKWYKKTTKIIKGVARMKTKALMVFKLDELGNIVYTQDIGDLAIFLSKSEPFCVTASSFPNMHPDKVILLDVDEVACVFLTDISPLVSVGNGPLTLPTPFHIPPQNIE